jgi:hypothetical protein
LGEAGAAAGLLIEGVSSDAAQVGNTRIGGLEN